MNETIVLVHGLWMNGFELSLLRRRLQRNFGAATCTFRYASIRHGLAYNAEQLNKFLRSLPVDKVHLVGHSLGGVLILHTLARFPNPQVDRVICLGSPLADSAPARDLARTRSGRRVIGRTLSDALSVMPLRSTGIAQPVGIIAGTKALGMGRLLGVLDRPNDGVVSVSETQCPGHADRLQLPVSHIGLIISAFAAEQTVAFIKHARFDHESC